MIKIKTKKEIRQELKTQVNAFLNSGGEIEGVDQGISGRELGANLNNAITLNEGKQTRTLLVDEIQALDERKKSKTPPNAKPEPHRPQKKIIYDDFGEPLREVWE